MNKCYTKVAKGVLSPEKANSLYHYLVNTVEWEDGIKSKHGFTRKAKHWEYGTLMDIDQAIINSLVVLAPGKKYVMAGIYLNYYENGDMYTPNHTHPKTHQLVISLGAVRDLVVGKKKYPLESGSTIIFGSSTHGVPKVANLQEGRISIAVFLIPQ